MKSLLSLASVSLLLSAILPAVALACPIPQDPSLKQMTTQSYNIALHTIPKAIVVGEPFSVSMWICEKTGATYNGTVSANATMPMHKHGMNYEPSIEALGNGSYLLNGFVFHMQGKWQFLFEIESNGKSEVLSLDHNLK